MLPRSGVIKNAVRFRQSALAGNVGFDEIRELCQRLLPTELTHLESATNRGIQMVDRACKAKWREPLGECCGF